MNTFNLLSSGEKKIRRIAILFGLLAVVCLTVAFFKVWFIALLSLVFHPSGIGIIALSVIAMISLVIIAKSYRS